MLSQDASHPSPIQPGARHGGAGISRRQGMINNERRQILDLEPSLDCAQKQVGFLTGLERGSRSHTEFFIKTTHLL